MFLMPPAVELLEQICVLHQHHFAISVSPGAQQQLLSVKGSSQELTVSSIMPWAEEVVEHERIH